MLLINIVFELIMFGILAGFDLCYELMYVHLSGKQQ
jgi:hypothetical protein